MKRLFLPLLFSIVALAVSPGGAGASSSRDDGNSGPSVTPTFSAQPQSLTLIAGQTANFSASAVGNPHPSISWLFSTDGGATYRAVSTLAQSGYRFEAVARSSAGSATSNPATLTLVSSTTPLAPTVTANPTSANSNAVSTAVIPNGGLPPMPQPVEEPAGFTQVTVAGQVVSSATTTSMNRSSVVMYTNSTWSVSIGAVAPNGSTVPLNAQGQLTATASQFILATGRGFKPNSLVGVYAFPVGVYLTTAQTNSTGSFTALVAFPSSFSAGTHTIQVTGLSSNSVARTVSIGVLTSARIVGVVARITFGLNTYMLTYAEYLHVKQVAAQLKTHHGLVVHIDGYSQPTPIDPYPAALSTARALTVKRILSALGVPGTLIATGHGGIGENLPTSRVVVISATWTS